MSCLLIVAAFCFSDAGKVAIDPQSTVARFATVAVGKADVQILLSSDSFGSFDATRMARACDGQTCIAYYRRCEPAGRAVTCSYRFGGAVYTQPVLVIRAPDQAALAKAEAAIAIFPGEDRERAVSLRLLSVESRGEPPTCRPEGGRMPKCPATN